ncbi:MAG: right-handed parallel beta-helix repeat-containing protein, partial [Planctomycetes bacterium]|nr:right-handed parallel beta-helix repeat-containing protein [Planctomycetota bacterium]
SIVNGYAGHGGAVFCRDFSSPTIANCRIVGNQSTMFGGAVCSMHGCSPTITNCLIARNLAPDPMFGIGGGVSCYESAATIMNCVIAGNTAGFRGGAIDLYGLSNPTITNSILWGNSAVQKPGVGTLGYGVYESPVGPCSPHLTASYSDIQDADPNQLAEWGPGNIGVDPLFLDAEAHDYRLGPDSPCIDAADNTAVPADEADLDGDGDTAERIPVDLDWRLRFADRQGTIDTGVAHPPDYPYVVDMGAYEYQCSGDLDGDGDIDLSDLAQLLSNYGTTGACYADGDIDLDGDVDLSDLAALLAVCGTTCP